LRCRREASFTGRKANSTSLIRSLELANFPERQGRSYYSPAVGRGFEAYPGYQKKTDQLKRSCIIRTTSLWESPGENSSVQLRCNPLSGLVREGMFRAHG